MNKSPFHLHIYIYLDFPSFHQTIRVIDWTFCQGAVSWDFAREHKMAPAQNWWTAPGWWLGHPSEKHESQLGWWLFPIYGKIKHGNQTTNQIWLWTMPLVSRLTRVQVRVRDHVPIDGPGESTIFSRFLWNVWLDIQVSKGTVPLTRTQNTYEQLYGLAKFWQNTKTLHSQPSIVINRYKQSEFLGPQIMDSMHLSFYCPLLVCVCC